MIPSSASGCTSEGSAPDLTLVVAHGSVSCAQVHVRPVFESDRTFTVRVRIAHGKSVGPVVMRFGSYSDTRAEYTYGPGTLWLYDVYTPKGAEVLQVSTKTGRVQNVVRMPKIFRPILAADDDGLWLAVATNGDWPNEIHSRAPIYRVAPGAHTPVIVHRGGRAALWLVAAGHSVWADVLTGEAHGEIWRFDASGATALAPADELNTWIAAAAPDGSSLWAVRELPVGGKYYSCSAERVFRIDARTGRQSAVATVLIPDETCDGTALATFADGAFSFVLDGRLYRVAP